MADEVLLQVEDGIATVTLNRPNALNSLSAALCTRLREVWAEARSRADISVVILTGAGSKAFTAGIDRSEIPVNDGEAPPYDPFTYDDMLNMIGPKANDVWKPVIVAVNGLACGGAFYLLGEADIVIAAEHATFFDPHVSYGMAAVYEPILLSGRMHFGDLARMSLTGLGERLSAETACRTGLVSEVVPAEELPGLAQRIATAIAASPTVPVQATVRALWTARRHGLTAALDSANFLLGAGNQRELLRRGQQSFATRQRPESITR
ncbi:enoyl-CoA hydratase/isomerase family protein [Enemella sp. A6]|uniref:enoyl-CoA hydratase/isomerase family protein n=1 Tax=Enemella sp. A6 TaxID=3440152 RepID=UPI003EBCF1BA